MSMATRRYQNDYKDTLFDEEPPAQEPTLEQPAQAPLPAPTSAEDATYAKRYADLRRHAQKIENEKNQTIADLKRQVAEAMSSQMALPKSEAELDAFYKQYPDGAQFIETIAAKIAEKHVQKINDQYADTLKGLKEAQHMTEHEKALQELMRQHPDFEEIRQKPEFHEWVERQPRVIQNALYENDTDAHAAARALDLYKADMAKAAPQPAKPRKPDVGAAAMVAPSKAPEVPSLTGDGKKVWTESEIKRLSTREFEALEEQINLAQREGRIVRDVTPPRR